jgi:DNA-binding MarR family transcriptional regulator
MDQKRQQTDITPADEMARIMGQWRVLIPDLDIDATSLWVHLRRTTLACVTTMGSAIEVHGITVSDYDTLAALYREGPPRMLTIKGIAAATARSSASISVHVEKLLKRKLVTRQTSKTDQRVSYIRLTASGAHLVETVIPPFIETQIQVTKALTRSELKTLNALLVKVAVSADRIRRLEEAKAS